MKLSEIQELMRSFDASGLTGLELSQDGTVLRLQKGGAPLAGALPASPAPAPAPAASPAAPAPAEPEESGLLEVKAPIVGVVYAAPAPDQPPYVRPGQRVEKGQTLCLIEAMKMMNEVEAPAAGTVRELRFQNGELAAFGDILVTLEPEA